MDWEGRQVRGVGIGRGVSGVDPFGKELQQTKPEANLNCEPECGPGWYPAPALGVIGDRNPDELFDEREHHNDPQDDAVAARPAPKESPFFPLASVRVPRMRHQIATKTPGDRRGRVRPRRYRCVVL